MSALPEVDWPNWTPTMEATLLFVVKGNDVLLIRKKRGLGAGKINGPGGKLEQGETPAQAAIRETQEELLIEVPEVTKRGELFFHFLDGLRLHAHVFTATDYSGTPTETEEAIPLWFPLGKIPFDEMWQDDIFWLPQALSGQSFYGRFIFDGEEMLWKDIQQT